MKIERTKNATRNIFFGVVLKIYQLLIPFVMRTLMIYLLGPGYAGLNGLFTSILQVLNLAELGVGSAMVFSMYKPIAEDDEDTICALMSLYRTYYRVIGLIIAVAGCTVIPFLPKLIKADLPSDINLYVLYLMNLAATVLTYWLFAYRNSVLTAHQRNDVANRVVMVTDTIKYIVQIIVLTVFRDYYLYVLAILFSQIIANIITAHFSKKLYPQYNPKGKLPKEEIKVINKRITDLFTSKLGSVIVGSADAIVISAFLGLTSLTTYQNYFYPINSVMGVITIVYTACTAGIGNSIIMETQEKNFNDLKKLTFIICWISGFCAACFLLLMQPFMKLWMGEKLMLNYMMVICLVAYFFIQEINSLLNLYKDAAGMWHEDRFRPLVTALSNLVMNLVMVQWWGLYGVILSTVISMLLIGMPWILHNLFTVLFERRFLAQYLKSLFSYTVVVIIIDSIVAFICLKITGNPLFEMIVRLVICTVLVNSTFIVIYHKTDEFNEAINLFDKMTKGKLKRIIKK
ncbi:lipopolysaccharide biosynthesis protein [Pseudobutyrivibrio xylanivorans]|uniref:Membrane protein involved in the export of O-antigen and teichoic acid n=1 Tax=Pseudobutyrivibrio xylanivorans DSM 14809 TaxID=1123012 RepID=A0A1M6I330_PSEXY|nr:polysaccharide biosynthesis protein [Pseudobutyrivibrio xylanivorans]SHJ28889.1 Membrane protein involved in the export of O-antigen and teichoic acid [Pseudobutyrivibrio xylanivorans DSM 14809]